MTATLLGDLRDVDVYGVIHTFAYVNSEMHGFCLQ